MAIQAYSGRLIIGSGDLRCRPGVSVFHAAERQVVQFHRFR